MRSLIFLRLLRKALRTEGKASSEQDELQQFGSHERNNSALRDHDIAEKLVELFVVANRELQVSRDDPTNKECKQHQHCGSLIFIRLPY